ncbi:hypothetical protein [Ruminiclostridium herbifermentans]|uniref:hypothetical protein n=1 Tax=Ruminiclostridium herbifermentans TaxID=2488810 RepID=UPI001FD13099|nr:hypothetical protein [Ruminiclostridium herbifermentans]
MGEEHFGYNDGLSLHGDIVCALKKYIGQTVTIFTTSGGMSGCGFTGVLLGVNECFVKLITQIGPAPGCSIGNSCSGTPYANGVGCLGDNMNMQNMNPIGTVGSVTDIPICSIACFTHNAI